MVSMRMIPTLTGLWAPLGTESLTGSLRAVSLTGPLRMASSTGPLGIASSLNYLITVIPNLTEMRRV